MGKPLAEAHEAHSAVIPEGGPPKPPGGPICGAAAASVRSAADAATVFMRNVACVCVRMCCEEE